MKLDDILSLGELSKVFKDFSVTTGLDVALHDENGKLVLLQEAGGNKICQKAMRSGYYTKCCDSLKYGGEKALELGEPYMYSCGCGLIMCSVPVAINDKILGSITCGPLLLWEIDDVAVSEFFKKSQPLFDSEEMAKPYLENIKQLDCINLTSSAHLLYIVVNYMLKTQNDYLRQRKQITDQQAEIANMLLEKNVSSKNVEIYERTMSLTRYPINTEKELIAYVQMGDRTNSKRILNNLLGEIFSFSSGNLDTMKARLIELMAILSRAAVDSGAPLEAFGENTKQYTELLTGNSDFEQVCFSTSQILDSFMNTVYEYRKQKKNSVHLANAIAYISENYQNEVNLEIVAKNIFVSTFYLSHLFREEMNLTFSDYVLSIRLQKAKLLLKQRDIPIKDVCFEVGFNDANYFAKAFKKAFGVSPKNYREFCN